MQQAVMLQSPFQAMLAGSSGLKSCGVGGGQDLSVMLSRSTIGSGSLAQELKSPQLDRRLETGALEELRLAGERLHYKLLRGVRALRKATSGRKGDKGKREAVGTLLPSFELSELSSGGWVSVKASGKVLLSRLEEAVASSNAKDESQRLGTAVCRKSVFNTGSFSVPGVSE
ncbi:hypothetical protein AK812_SmicGene21809 [Symbiodinium microadriaticum]|uniref:Uncharacterized protein n=1 Tax=Symbiodinium microadriaticum TaxID=2951 RepID=A0A1Q9DLG6_SYMMI|nr:hypothetical protein AK812_SmicGene21809 [Symbiodinium microadriaticum]